MVSQDLNIDFKIGIHGRPAVLLVQKVKTYPDTEITISKNGKSSKANSLMGLLALGINQGSTITVSAEGKDEEKALNDIIDYIRNVLAKEK
ncbi:MAG: HPr family phosphocarrier protein [Armatimonadota bacterium]